MNRVYKIVWSKAKNAYVVTSELAKNHTKSASGKAVKAALTAAVGMGVLMGGYAADAAAKDIVDKGGNPIAYDISPENDGTNIAIGKNAKVFIGGGTQESMLSFGETVDPTYWHGIIRTGWNIHSNTDAKKNLPAGMSVGKNTYARTGSIQIGDHTLEKNQIAIGDTTADKLRQFGVASTTLGTNSYTGGGFATTIGSYNVQSSQYEAANSSDTLSNSTKNAFSTVVGTLNSNESMTGSSSSGVSNMISGVANKVTNSNGAIVMGAGNSIKNSSAAFDTSAYSTPYNSVATMQKALMDGVARSAGGSTLAIGGANAAEYTQASQLIGVGNTLTGKSGNVSKYNMLDGYKNKASNVQHVSVIGSENNVTNTNGAVVFGDKRTLTGADGSIVIGSSANGTATSVKNAIAIGSETNVTVAGGVALGSSSVASVDKGAVGYDASGTNHNSDTTGVWKSTAAAVSVGDAAGNTKVTRQITNVAAGKEDTDAVNVAQLKAVKAAADAAKVHFFSVKGNSSDENYNNDGATGDRALAVGVAAKAGGLKATALTGGQQQRVALARAIVIRPQVLLMDEPLSNLDAKLRIEMRNAIKQIQRRVDITTVYVTHDQEEALAVSDRIAVMNGGVICQIGRPADIYKRPKNVFVSTFIGLSNLLDGHIVKKGDKTSISFKENEDWLVDMDNLSGGVEDGEEVIISVRPEEFDMEPGTKEGIRGVIRSSVFLGLTTHYFITTGSGQELEILQTQEGQDILPDGSAVTLTVKAGRINVFRRATEETLIREEGL